MSCELVSFGDSIYLRGQSFVGWLASQHRYIFAYRLFCLRGAYRMPSYVMSEPERSGGDGRRLQSKSEPRVVVCPVPCCPATTQPPRYPWIRPEHQHLLRRQLLHLGTRRHSAPSFQPPTPLQCRSAERSRRPIPVVRLIALVTIRESNQVVRQQQLDPL